jgi:hypothetical protein
MDGAHVVAIGGAGPFAQVAHVGGTRVKFGRGAFHPFPGSMCLSPQQWSITATDGTAQLTSIGRNKTCVWFPDGNRADVARGETLEVLDGCFFGVRYWTNESFVNEPKRALCTFWADRLGSSDDENYDSVPCE